jgi:hypothetical protein
MKWAALLLVALIAAFAISAFVSREECMEKGSLRSCRTGEITYWWDR